VEDQPKQKKTRQGSKKSGLKVYPKVQLPIIPNTWSKAIGPSIDELRRFLKEYPMATLAEAGAYFGVDTSTITKRCAHHGLTYGQVRENAMVTIKQWLVKLALEKAETSDLMHKECLKHIVGWHDKSQVEQSIRVENEKNEVIDVKQIKEVINADPFLMEEGKENELADNLGLDPELHSGDAESKAEEPRHSDPFTDDSEDSDR
jgi:hypothetical protein